MYNLHGLDVLWLSRNKTQALWWLGFDQLPIAARESKPGLPEYFLVLASPFSRHKPYYGDKGIFTIRDHRIHPSAPTEGHKALIFTLKALSSFNVESDVGCNFSKVYQWLIFFFKVQHLPAPNELLSSSGIVVVRDRVQKKCDCVCPPDGRPLLCCRVPSFGARMSCFAVSLAGAGGEPEIG